MFGILSKLPVILDIIPSFHVRLDPSLVLQRTFIIYYENYANNYAQNTNMRNCWEKIFTKSMPFLLSSISVKALKQYLRKKTGWRFIYVANLLNSFHDIMLNSFFHVHDAADVFMLLVTVDSTAEYQLQHSAELSLVTPLRCNIHTHTPFQ